MVYECELGEGRKLYIEPRGELTGVTLASGGPGQQQQQGGGFQTGALQCPPTIYRTPGGIVVRLDGTKGQHWIAISAGGMQSVGTPPDLSRAEVLSTRSTEGASTAGTVPRMEPMKPMEPMRPMEPMKPMEMRMGNMEMRMGGSSAPREEQQFCTQCGRKLAEGDKFCGGCGHAARR